MAHRFQARHGLGLVIIDQLDRVLEPEKRGENLSARIGRTTRKLKDMARDLRVPVICLVQLLDKQTATRKSPRPGYGDVRDSSHPDQDCDVMLYLWRPEFYWPNKPGVRGLAEIIVARQRSGPPGSVWVRWKPRYTSFANLPPDEWPREKLG
ncbi:DnaB-like helicase C-terminal domain-containing protein [Candidatus Igneacidithiobacillus taiwanensis]|uniref:DnaB-like helicase C-terminal domain-containing protein n=1 Tax=Candidatus Igneacidithiobacillus taiwanensis TaxID=1945924 RepID=UPI003916F029